jgi:hypothetical protein
MDVAADIDIEMVLVMWPAHRPLCHVGSCI